MAKAARIERNDASGVENEISSPIRAELSVTSPVPAKVVAPSVPVMTGTHFHALDEKSRVIIPSKLRPALTEQFWLMLDENDNIGVYNYGTGMDVLAHCEELMAEYPGDEEIATAVERITGTAELVAAESSWRVPVPELLRFHAQLDKEVVTVGVLNHAVIWSRERWEAAQVQRLQAGDVRKTQAAIMRGAASGFKKLDQKKVSEQAVQRNQNEQAQAETASVETSVAAPRVLAAGARPFDAARRTVAESASAGDGRGSSRLLTLSKLGR
jgi:MraZ protein